MCEKKRDYFEERCSFNTDLVMILFICSLYFVQKRTFEILMFKRNHKLTSDIGMIFLYMVEIVSLSFVRLLLDIS